MIDPDTRIAEASAVRPSPRQLAWQQLEFYGFIHFGMNTMTDREWGLGHEDPALFNPSALDARQWVEVLKSAGMRGLILTCKHHDGFCLWPSKLTKHSVASSPWRHGKGDVVAEVAQACAAAGLKFGVYLSPWDRTEQSYGSGKPYDDYFVGQLTELMTQYGPVFDVWFDGANGEGPNGKVQTYDWERYFGVVRDLAPEAVISVCGPDVRWCGNEAGHTRAEEWSVVPASLRNAERIAERSQKEDDGTFSRQVRSDEEDLGSRAAILASNEELVWYPAEVNTSIRPGWFYHAKEDAKVRSVEELFAIYRGSVGGNATFLLNVPPDAAGLIAAPDRAVLADLGRAIMGLGKRNIADRAACVARNSSFDPATGWQAHSADPAPSLTLNWSAPVLIDALVLEEEIAKGQQVDALTVEVQAVPRGGWEMAATVGAIGNRRIVMLEPRKITGLRLCLAGMRGPCHLRAPGVLAAVPSTD